MTVTQRRYKLLSDFARVHTFLTEIYTLDTLNSYLLPQFFEYAHTHPMFNHKLTHRFGLWEDNGRLVGIACYEMDIGQSFLVTHPEHTFLLPEMLPWAERELSGFRNGRQVLHVWVTDKEREKTELLESNGYRRVHSEPVRILPYSKPFPEANFRPDLTTVIKAPDGDYACFAGMWFDERNNYAYLEPLATVPAYRRMGLAKAALVEAMEKTKELGATYCFGGVPEFYAALGFETICQREMWKKEWYR